MPRMTKRQSQLVQAVPISGAARPGKCRMKKCKHSLGIGTVNNTGWLRSACESGAHGHEAWWCKNCNGEELWVFCDNKTIRSCHQLQALGFNPGLFKVYKGDEKNTANASIISSDALEFGNTLNKDCPPPRENFSNRTLAIQ